MNNKIKKLDGMPGLTLQGIKGNSGIRGTRVFHSYHNSTIDAYQYNQGGTVFRYPVYDIWDINGSFLSPTVADNMNYYLDMDPIPHDHILYAQSESIYLYEVLDYSKMNESYAPSVLTDAQIKTVKDYYMNDSSSNDVCIVRYLDSFSQNENNTSVVVTDKPIKYDAWDGALDPTNNKVIKYSDTFKLLSFDVVSSNGNLLGETKIVAEFVPPENNGLMSSTKPQLWNIDIDDVSAGATVPETGYPWKYSNELNFDNENLRNFTVIIKDWEEGSNTTSYSSSVVINKNSVVDYTIILYAYINNGTYKLKKYIGEFDFTTF